LGRDKKEPPVVTKKEKKTRLLKEGGFRTKYQKQLGRWKNPLKRGFLKKNSLSGRAGPRSREMRWEARKSKTNSRDVVEEKVRKKKKTRCVEGSRATGTKGKKVSRKQNRSGRNVRGNRK